MFGSGWLKSGASLVAGATKTVVSKSIDVASGAVTTTADVAAGAVTIGAEVASSAVRKGAKVITSTGEGVTGAVGKGVEGAAEGYLDLQRGQDPLIQPEPHDPDGPEGGQRSRQSRPVVDYESLELEGVGLGVVKVCEICLRDFEEIKLNGVHIVSTVCGHVFCRECITEALNNNGTCPHCRQQVERSQLRRLFV